MATSILVTAHRSDEDAPIAVDSPAIGIRIVEPADTEEMPVDGHSDGGHAWCVKVQKSPLQLQVEGGSCSVNWSLPLRSRSSPSPDLDSAPLSSPPLSPPLSPSVGSPGSVCSGYDFGLYTPPDDRRELDDSTGDYVQLQDFQDQLTRRGELLPLLQESPDLLSFNDSPLEREILRLTFSEEEVALLTNSVLDPNSPSADCLFPNSSSPSLPLSGCPTGSPGFPLGPLPSANSSENRRSSTVLTTEIPPLGRKPLEEFPPLPPSPGLLLLEPDSAPNSTSNPSMDDNRVSDRPLSTHRHNSMSSSPTAQGPHGVHGSAVTHYHSPENRPHSPSFVRRSLARHARIRSRSASPYEASSEVHAHPRRSSSRSTSDFHAQSTDTQPLLAHSHRPSPRGGHSYRLRAASFDAPTSKTAPPTSNLRAYKPDEESAGDDVEMDPRRFAGATRKRAFSLSSSSTSSSNSIPSPQPPSSTGYHALSPIVRGSRSYYDHNTMAIDFKDDEAGPSTDEGESESEADEDYPGSRPSSFNSYSLGARYSHTSRASPTSYPDRHHHPRSHSVSPSRPVGHGEARHTYRITAVAPSQVSPTHASLSCPRRARRVSHSPVRRPEAVLSKAEELNEDPYYEPSSPRPFSGRHSRGSYYEVDPEDEEAGLIDEEDDDEYRDPSATYIGSRRSSVKRAALPRRASNAHLTTKPIYGSPLKGSILPTDRFSDGESSPAVKPRTPSTRGRPRSGSGALSHPYPRPVAANTSTAGTDASAVQYRNVGSKNIDLASEKRRKGEKRFQCCYKDCKKMFTTNQNRQIHQWKHTGEKPYRCKCGYGSASRSDLQRHLRRKKTVNPLCDEIPVDKLYLNQLVNEVGVVVEDDD